MKSTLACCLLACASSAMTQALPDASPAAIWRATSRLGYGPTAQTLAAAAPSAKAWSIAQLEAAYQASQRPAQVPEALAAITAGADEVTQRFHAEREARRLGRASLQRPAEGSRPVESTPPASLAAMIQSNEPEDYSRVMAQSAVAWRLLSCSNPQIEDPLLARMTEFWFNHFNVFLDKGSVRPYVGSYLLHAIRPHALGKFEDLLLATAQHPAMLLYLDQAQSTSRGLNENYARELMELHTLGVDGGYTQADVRELARVLTGWSVDIQGSKAFLFRPRAHEAGPKTLMGRTFSSPGQQQGIDAIRFLASHPATALRISTRLATFFVADKPPAELVDRLRRNFLDTGGDLRSLMRTLIESPQFWDAQHTLFKTPQDFACSALAAAGPIGEGRQAVQAIRLTVGFLGQTGQSALRWPTPDGYKTDAGTWLAPEALTRRADYAFTLAARMPEPEFLHAYFTPATRERIRQESSEAMRTGLALSGPQFMTK